MATTSRQPQPPISSTADLLPKKQSLLEKLYQKAAEHQSLHLTEDCPDYPIGCCNLPLGKPSHHWFSTLHATTRTSFRVVVGCDGLEVDASRFRRRMNGTAPGESTCKLCLTAPEDPAHFILHCPSLSTRRHELR